MILTLSLLLLLLLIIITNNCTKNKNDYNKNNKIGNNDNKNNNNDKATSNQRRGHAISSISSFYKCKTKYIVIMTRKIFTSLSVIPNTSLPFQAWLQNIYILQGTRSRRRVYMLATLTAYFPFQTSKAEDKKRKKKKARKKKMINTNSLEFCVNDHKYELCI